MVCLLYFSHSIIFCRANTKYERKQEERYFPVGLINGVNSSCHGIYFDICENLTTCFELISKINKIANIVSDYVV